MKKCALIVFAKPPIAGLAKTRLIPALGEAGAANYHAKLLGHTLTNVVCDGNWGKDRGKKWDTHLWCSENSSHPFFVTCQKNHSLKLHEQSHGDLGERMFHAITNMLKDYEKVCIIGSDCPVIDREKIAKVFDDLKNNTDVVITPAEDGGYVLLAVKEKILADIFFDIQWGGAHVFQRTLNNLQKISFNPIIQPTLWDIDEPEDLARITI